MLLSLGSRSFETQKRELEKILEYKHMVLMPMTDRLANEEIMWIL